MRQFDFQKFLKNNPLLKEGYTPDERIYIGKASKTGPLAAASDSLYSMEKALKQLDRVIDSNPDISAKSVIKMVLKTLNDIRTKQKIGMNESGVKEGYTPSDKIYIGPPVKSGPLSVASSYLQVLEKNMKTLNKIADSNPDITAKKITSMVLKTFEDIRAAQKSGDPLFQGDFSMNENKQVTVAGTDMTNTAKSYWNKFDTKKRIDFLVGAGYSKPVATDLSSEDWDSLETEVQKGFTAPFNLMKLLGRM